MSVTPNDGQHPALVDGMLFRLEITGEAEVIPGNPPEPEE